MSNSIKNYLIKAKVKDPSGAETISTPISLKVSNTAGACRYTMPPIVIADTSSTTLPFLQKDASAQQNGLMILWVHNAPSLVPILFILQPVNYRMNAWQPLPLIVSQLTQRGVMVTELV